MLKNLSVKSALPIMLIAIGVTLLLYMIFVEEEPTPIPPVLIISGITWFFYLQKKLKIQHHKSQ